MSVFANGLEVSGKATPNKTIAAMPDVCMSPPPPPAGPVPIPYPLTGMASDTTDGCTSVFVKGKEAGKKNASKYSKTTGDEPATNSFGAGVVSHKITGPLKFAAYSFDVIFEGGGAERFTDLTTQNHMNMDNASVGMSAAQAAVGASSPETQCKKLEQANKEVREDIERNSRRTSLSKKSRAKYKEAAGAATITHGVFTPTGGTSRVVRACSRVFLCRRYKMSQGMKLNKPKPGARKTKESKACGGHVYEEVRNNKQGGAHPTHTESRIIEEIFKAKKPPTGGTLVLAINWNSAEPGQEKDACPHCKALLCAVDKKSNKGEGCLDIKICHGSPPEQKSLKDLKWCN
jgi:hypothetical protein